MARGKVAEARPLDLGVPDSNPLFKGASRKASPPANDEAAVWVPIEKIHPGKMQYRAYFDESFINGLADTFKGKGFKGVINVRPGPDDTYEIVAGEQRWRAAKQAGLNRVACLISEYTDEEALEFGLFENVKRKDTSKLETLEAVLKLLQFRHGLAVGKKASRQWVIDHLFSDGRQYQRNQKTGRTGATSEKWQTTTKPTLDELGVSIETIHRWLRLLTIPEDIRQAHLTGELAFIPTLEISKLQEDGATEKRKAKTKTERWRPLLKEAIEKKLSKSEIIARIKEIKAADSPKRQSWGEKLLRQFGATYKRVQKSIDTLDKEKAGHLEALLKEIDALLEAEPD